LPLPESEISAGNSERSSGAELKKIVFASRNRGKIREIRSMLAGSGIDVLSLEDYPDHPEIREDGKSFLENALKKAKTVSEATGETVLADDSGLEVDALDGAPGIYSARYAGDDADDEKNILKLLNDLKGFPSGRRNSAFRCVLVLYRPDATYDFFEGRWEGRITQTPVGESGFGYDPVFFLPEMGVTVAQLTPEVKNRISHRAQAFTKLREHLQKSIW
jgi:XTP/dITP diphosphohydrolase